MKVRIEATNLFTFSVCLLRRVLRSNRWLPNRWPPYEVVASAVGVFHGAFLHGAFPLAAADDFPW